MKNKNINIYNLFSTTYKKRKMFLKKYEFKKNIVGMDVPLLYETGLNKICNYIFLALTSEANQEKRVLKRKNMNIWLV